MSNFLINEPPLVVLPTLAVKLGLEKAIILQQIQYWASKEKNVRDGYAWVYNTYEVWHQQMPFMSERSIRRHVTEMEKAGILVSTDGYNDSKWDRTKWYRINHHAVEGLSDTANLDTSIRDDEAIVQKPLVDAAKTGDSEPARLDGSLKETKTNAKTTTKTNKPRSSGRKTDIPTDFTLDDTHMEVATSRGLSKVVAQREFEKFKTYCEANGRKYVNWTAAWRNWVANHCEWNGIVAPKVDTMPDGEKSEYQKIKDELKRYDEDVMLDYGDRATKIYALMRRLNELDAQEQVL